MHLKQEGFQAPEVWQALHTMIRAAVVTGREQPVIAPSASVRRIR